MRRFFDFGFDDRDNLSAVSKYELGDFDLTLLWKGRRLSSGLPKSVKLWVGDGQASDCVANPISWEIVSDRLWRLIEPLVSQDVQIVPAPLFSENTGDAIEGYLICNITRKVRGAVVDIDSQTLEIRGELVPDDVNIFRLAESPTRILISDSVRDAIKNKGLTGVALLWTKLAR